MTVQLFEKLFLFSAMERVGLELKCDSAELNMFDYNTIQRLTNVLVRGLVKFVLAVAYHTSRPQLACNIFTTCVATLYQDCSRSL